MILEAKVGHPNATEMTYWIALSMLMMELHTSLRYINIIPPDTPIPTDEKSLNDMMTEVAKAPLEIPNDNNPPLLREMLLRYVSNHLSVVRVELLKLYAVAPATQREHLLPILSLVGAVEQEFRKQ